MQSQTLRESAIFSTLSLDICQLCSAYKFNVSIITEGYWGASNLSEPQHRHLARVFLRHGVATSKTCPLDARRYAGATSF